MQEVKELAKVRAGIYRVSGSFLRHMLKQVFFRFHRKPTGNMHHLLHTYMCVETFFQIWLAIVISLSICLEIFSPIYVKSC